MGHGFVEKAWKQGAAAAVIAFGLLSAQASHAVTVLKQVQVSNGSQIDLLFDGKVQKEQIKTEFTGDVIQLSIQDVSVYPAKISSVNGGSLTKIFAYQYAPKLVRCRLTVKGKAEDYKSKLDIKAGGRILTVRMPDANGAIAKAKSSPKARGIQAQEGESGQASAGETDAEEKALLSRVIAASESAAKAPARAEAPKAQALDKASPGEKPSKDSITVSSAAPATQAPAGGASGTENLPIRLSGESGAALAGAKPLPSPLKAFGKMGIVLGLFGLLAFALKRVARSKAESRLTRAGLLAGAKQGSKLKAAEGGWLGAIGRMAKGFGRENKMIEVLSTHYLGPKKSIAVVRVAGRILVLGVSNESINLITQLSGEDALNQLDEQLDAVGLGDALGLDDVGPSLEPPMSRRAKPSSAPIAASTSAMAPARGSAVAGAGVGAGAGAGATAAGGPVFADLLNHERAKPAFVNPSAQSAYKADAGVRAKIRNRLEGLKPL